jgi:murein DD-endopeptidase MepM/ murein hydrolase activator NlpD
MTAAASGGLGPSLLPGPLGQTGNSETLETMLRTAVADPGRSAQIPPLAFDLAASARREGLSQAAVFRAVFPRPESILSMLALDRDVDDFNEAGEGEGAAAAHYRRAADAALVFRPLRSNYSLLFSEAWRLESKAPAAPARTGLDLADLAPKGSFLSPIIKELAYSHPYALDIFFRTVTRRGKAEFGPPISALEEGIVVAASGNWRGGAGASAWKGGGLSPSAGNGVVIYAPSSARYYSYFHLSEVQVEVGQTLARGEVLGRGGNSGANARKSEHGRHLHLEIFDAGEDRALSAREIRDMLF